MELYVTASVLHPFWKKTSQIRSSLIYSAATNKILIYGWQYITNNTHSTFWKSGSSIMRRDRKKCIYRVNKSKFLTSRGAFTKPVHSERWKHQTLIDRIGKDLKAACNVSQSTKCEESPLSPNLQFCRVPRWFRYW